MTDERTQELPGEDTNEADRPGRTTEDGSSEGDSPWFKEGADAPDAADIEDPDAQR